MNRKVLSLSALIFLSMSSLFSCQNKGDKAKDITLKVEKVQDSDKAPIMDYVSEMTYISIPSKLTIDHCNESSGYLKFEKNLQANNCSAEYFSKHKEEIISQVSDANFQTGIKYQTPDPFYRKVEIEIDGSVNQYGCYVEAFRATRGSKYHITYLEDNKSCEFNIWLPTGPVFYESMFYKSYDMYMYDVNHYCLL